ncbi:hypothetical protein [Microbacterium ginsengisoli]|nr:hypothetical protein [Microbacteriaceae bacterium K1510]
MTRSTPSARWTVEDYAAIVRLSGAEKLADSQVAPLVAQARGYETVEDADTAKAVASRVYTAEERKVQNRLKMLTKANHEFTVIPWFRASELFKFGRSVEAASIQIRPSDPLPDPITHKVRKYEFLASSATVIDANPGTPIEWFERTTTFLITEGAIKGDSALSAQLLGAGITHAELAPVDGSVTDARERLGELLLRIPELDRVPVLSIAGVANWHNNSEWAQFIFKDREVLIAFDGDLRENHNVWSQAAKMWRLIGEAKQGLPKLLDLGGADAEKNAILAGLASGTKLGVDDYLSHVGPWSELITLVEDTLPNEPHRNREWKPGEFRVADDGASVIEYAKIERGNEFGGVTYAWEERVPIGGRVTRISNLRTLADTNVRDGDARRPGAVLESAKGDCTIELRWTDDTTGDTIVREITGPRAILELAPADWGRKGAMIHADILRHPAWPPRNRIGDGFLAAIKANRFDEQDVLNGWDTMGWVPTRSGEPVFVIGEQSLGSSVQDERDNRPGVTEEIMPMASNYGVADTYWAFHEADDLEGYKAQVRSDIRAAVEAFITDPGWNLPAVGPTMLACALRPTVPSQTSINVYISGAPGTGKSYLASFVMAFWGPRPGIWTEHNLPGQASDTAAAREHSVARTPIYVIDDLAPNVSRSTSERQESAVEDAIRSNFNGAGKRRGTADGDQRTVSRPRALHIFTAENRRDTSSIQQRYISIHLAAATKRTDRDRPREIELVARGADNPFARLTAAMIRFWLNIDVEQTPLPMLRREVRFNRLDTWRGKYEFVRSSIDAAKTHIQNELLERYGIGTGDSARRAGMFAELFVTLDVLQALGLWAGLDPRDPAMEPFFARPSEIGQLRGAMIDLAAQDLREFKRRSNSRNLLEAVRNVLEAGKAHLEHPTIPGSKPILSGENADAINAAAGWRVDARTGDWVPQGTPIGFLGVPSDKVASTELVALLSPANAFNLAQREHPSLVPAGQKAGDSWNQVWEDEGGALVHSRYQRPVNGRETTVKARIVGENDVESDPNIPARVTRLRGIPVRFSELVPMLDGD